MVTRYHSQLELLKEAPVDFTVPGEGSYSLLKVSTKRGLKIQGVFFLWIQSGGCKTDVLMSFRQFLYFLHSKLWAHFHFGTFDPLE